MTRSHGTREGVNEVAVCGEGEGGGKRGEER